MLTANKFRNAGQVCVSPTRFLVHEKHYGRFVEGFTEFASTLPVGDGMDPETKMGPLAHDRRVDAIEGFVSDAVGKGATVHTGGGRKGNEGYFFEPTVLTDVPMDARIMNEEPFGPVAIVNRFSTYEDAITEANRLPFGLASYAFTSSGETAQRLGQESVLNRPILSSWDRLIEYCQIRLGRAEREHFRVLFLNKKTF